MYHDVSCSLCCCSKKQDVLCPNTKMTPPPLPPPPWCLFAGRPWQWRAFHRCPAGLYCGCWRGSRPGKVPQHLPACRRDCALQALLATRFLEMQLPVDLGGHRHACRVPGLEMLKSLMSLMSTMPGCDFLDHPPTPITAKAVTDAWRFLLHRRFSLCETLCSVTRDETLFGLVSCNAC